MAELEIIYPICAKGCRKMRDAEFLEDIRYSMLSIELTITTVVDFEKLLAC